MKRRYTRRFSLLGMQVELVSNYQDIIADDEYFMSKGACLHSLLSNFHQLLPADDDAGVDLQVFISDEPEGSGLKLERREGIYRFIGPIRELERHAGDKRAAIFGNMGIFSKILVRELERRGIFSFHSTSFIIPGTDRLVLVLGGSGAGKSTVLLRAVIAEQEIFGTELTHLQFREDGIRFLKGSLWQNCKMGNIVEDFPALLDTFGIDSVPEGNPWKQYRSIDMRPWSYAADWIDNPQVTILFPRIEQERSRPERYTLSPEGIAYPVYENLSDKVSPPSAVYRKFFIPSLDEGDDQRRRMAVAERFVREAGIDSVWKVLTSPDECLDTII